MSFTTKLREVPELERLRQWNIWLAVIYVLQAVAVLVVGSTQLAPLSVSFLTIDSLLTTTSGSLVLAPATHHLFDLNLLYVAFGIMVVLAIVHASQASWYRNQYETRLQKNHNDTRWVAYGLSATLTFLVLSILVGVTDVALLLVVLTLSVILHTLCAWIERSVGQRNKSKGGAWFSYGVMVLAGLGMWSVIVIYLLASNIYGGGHIPARVYWLAATAAVTAFSFALGLWRHTRNPKTGQAYRLTDQRYMILMLVTSSLLVWEIVAGTMN